MFYSPDDGPTTDKVNYILDAQKSRKFPFFHIKFLVDRHTDVQMDISLKRKIYLHYVITMFTTVLQYTIFLILKYHLFVL